MCCAGKVSEPYLAFRLKRAYPIFCEEAGVLPVARRVDRVTFGSRSVNSLGHLPDQPLYTSVVHLGYTFIWS